MIATTTTTALEQFHCTWSSPLVLVEEVGAQTSLTLEHYLNTARNTLTMRLTFRSNQTKASHMGIGINLEGNDWIAPSVSVIGRTDTADVRWYEIVNDAKDGSGVLPLFPNDDGQDMRHSISFLQEATFLQDEGTSILNFTVPLQLNTNIDGGTTVSIADTDNKWIYATGNFLDNGNWVNEHFGAFNMTLEDRCKNATNSDVMSDPIDTSNVTEVGDKGESKRNGGPPVSPSSLSTKDVSGMVWTMHKWLMAAAWGVMAPLSIGASLLQKLFLWISGETVRYSKPIWYLCHLYLGALSIVLTFLGMFVLAIIPVVDGVVDLPRDDPSFRTHSMMGYVVFVVVAAYATASVSQFGFHYVPPPPPRIRDAETEATVDSGTDESESSSTGSGIEGGGRWFSPLPQNMSERSDRSFQQRQQNSLAQVSHHVRATTATGRDETDCNDATPTITGTIVRQGRRILFHRLVGMILLGSAWWACQTGYAVLAETSLVFWACLSAISVLVFAGIAIQVEQARPPGNY